MNLATAALNAIIFGLAYGTYRDISWCGNLLFFLLWTFTWVPFVDGVFAHLMSGTTDKKFLKHQATIMRVANKTPTWMMDMPLAFFLAAMGWFVTAGFVLTSTILFTTGIAELRKRINQEEEAA